MRNLTPFLLIVFFVTAFGRSSKACSCMPNGYYFCETIHNDTTIKVIGLFQKVSTIEYGFKAIPLNIYHGTALTDTITIWCDNGGLCRIGDGWSVGSKMILALQQCDTMGNVIYNPDYPPNLEKATDYQVSVCGYYSLEVVGSNVVGSITAPTTQTIPLSTFEADNCALTLGVNELALAEALKVYPVPCHDRLTVEFMGQSIEQARVIDARGMILLSQPVNNEKLELNLNGWTGGIYYLRLQTSQGTITRRFQLIR